MIIITKRNCIICPKSICKKIAVVIAVTRSFHTIRGFYIYLLSLCAQCFCIVLYIYLISYGCFCTWKEYFNGFVHCTQLPPECVRFFSLFYYRSFLFRSISSQYYFRHLPKTIFESVKCVLRIINTWNFSIGFNEMYKCCQTVVVSLELCCGIFYFRNNIPHVFVFVGIFLCFSFSLGLTECLSRVWKRITRTRFGCLILILDAISFHYYCMEYEAMKSKFEQSKQIVWINGCVLWKIEPGLGKKDSSFSLYDPFTCNIVVCYLMSVMP